MQVVPSTVGGWVLVSESVACTRYGPGSWSDAGMVSGIFASADGVVGNGTVVAAGTVSAVSEVVSSTE